MIFIPKKDLTNQRIGNLIVLKDSGQRQNKKIMWECQCDCGNVWLARSDHLLSGKTISCPQCVNQRKIKNLQGQKFGKLLVLEATDKRDKDIGTVIWKCQCDCGNFTTA